jgi:hypothetical protein
MEVRLRLTDIQWKEATEFPNVPISLSLVAPSQVRLSASACIKITVSILVFFFASMEGFVAWREDSGSWFMQALCELLLSCGSRLDLLTLLTLVTQKVAIDCESNCPSSPDYHRKKQIPSTITMLTRLLTFSPS